MGWGPWSLVLSPWSAARERCRCLHRRFPSSLACLWLQWLAMKPRRRQVLLWIVACVGGLLFLFRDYVSHYRTAGLSDAEQMRSALARMIPAGASIYDARRVMEQEDFHCSLDRNATWDDDAQRQDILF